MEKICDHKSVGMLVWKDEKLLLVERMKFPLAFAPPAGHCDGADFVSTAKKELEEEVGLVAVSLKLVAEGRKENPCRRVEGAWHYWQIFEVEAEGEIKRSETETKQIKWVEKEELRSLAKRTQEYDLGKISADDWEKNPGLEQVWCEWLSELKII
ncbi:MAG: NUDIX hydrolase [Candidatus Moranbacteria bacterium]|nr:NUDIX hydrolase [Candidatus Moranbacteria bacterium]